MSEDLKRQCFAFFSFGLISGIIITYFCAAIATYKTYGEKPSALNVYQGKTTLEITYRDGVPIDSVVVFKKK